MSSPIEDWLATESHRLWLLGERALRALQAAHARPVDGHIDAVLAARRLLRLGPTSTPEDDAALTEAIAAADTLLVSLRRAVPFGRFIAVLGLRPLEIEILATAVVSQLDPGLSDLFAALRGTAARGVDLALLAVLLRLVRGERAFSLEALAAERPLVRWHLIDIAPVMSPDAFSSNSHRAIRATPDLVATLCGRRELPAELARRATLVSAPATLADLRFDDEMRRDAQAMCDAAARDPQGGPDAPWLVLWGPAGIGKRTLAARIAAHARRALVTFDPSCVPLDDALARVQREAMVRDAMLYVGPIPSELQTRLPALLEHFQGPLAFGIDGMQSPRLSSSRPLWELQLRVPAEPTRTELWSEALPAPVRGPDLDVEMLARAFKLTPGEIVASAREATAIAAREHVTVSHEAARTCIARRLRTDLGELARPVEVTATWNDLVLPEPDLERVHEFIARKKFATQVYADWGYGARVGGGKGLVALFSGPPGTGKTMLAGVIAQALDLDLYQVDLGQVVSKWVGETEKQLGNVFDQAERAHAVLLFDEADSLFAKRTEVQSSSDRYGNMAVNYLLQRLEQYTGVAVLTTNKDASLDEALQRRLTLRLFLDIPDTAERARLWRSFMPSRAPTARDVDVHALAEEFELSGGYIKNAAVRAAFLAAARGTVISMELLRLAASLELEDMGRVVWQRRLAA